VASRARLRPEFQSLLAYDAGPGARHGVPVEAYVEYVDEPSDIRFTPLVAVAYRVRRSMARAGLSG